MSRRERRLVSLCAAAALILIAAAAPWRAVAAPHPKAALPRCRTVAACRRAILWERSRYRAVIRDRWRLAEPTIRDAAIIAAHAFPGVNPWAMIRVARCETGLPYADRLRRVYERNSATAEGPWQFLDSTWRHTPFAELDRDVPIISALAAAQIVQKEGWQQWDCKP